MINRRQVGYKYEEIAAQYLKEKGYILLEKNYYTRWGEIDLILRKGSTIVFAEVKYRKNSRFGVPEEAVDWKKRQRIVKGANWYLMTKGLQGVAVSLDIVSIEGDQIRHIPGAINGEIGWI